MSVELILALYELLKEKVERTVEEYRVCANEINKKLNVINSDKRDELFPDITYKLVKLEEDREKYEKFLKEFKECKF